MESLIKKEVFDILFNPENREMLIELLKNRNVIEVVPTVWESTTDKFINLSQFGYTIMVGKYYIGYGAEGDVNLYRLIPIEGGNEDVAKRDG